jgi:glycosyltransferase involved in cell wall biosynthesis
MRILLLTPTLPYPLDTGGRIVVFNTIKRLSKNHEIFLVSLVQERQRKHVSVLRDYCVKVETVKKDISFTGKGLLLNLFSSIPYSAARYHSPEMGRKIEQIASEHKFDLAQIEHLHMAQYARHIRGVPIILRQHNVESVMMRRYYRYASSLPQRIYAYLQYRKLLRYERHMCLRSDVVVALSRADQAFIKKLSPKIKTEVVSCGVDFEHFKFSTSPRESNLIVYVGGLSFPPVFESVLHFLKKTWPKIKRTHPHVKLHILGSCPRDKLRRMGNIHDVVFEGYVEDIRSRMAAATLAIVPHRIASGIRLKILESMAVGLPMVTTSIGCEGIDVTDGEHILVADDPDTFAHKVTRLLNDQCMRQIIARKGHQMVKQNYTWEVVEQELNRIYCSQVVQAH